MKSRFELTSKIDRLEVVLSVLISATGYQLRHTLGTSGIFLKSLNILLILSISAVARIQRTF